MLEIDRPKDLPELSVQMLAAGEVFLDCKQRFAGSASTYQDCGMLQRRSWFHACPQVHRRVFEADSKTGKDVRVHLQAVRSSILQGVHLVFSHIIPQNYPEPQSHPMWQLAEQVWLQWPAEMQYLQLESCCAEPAWLAALDVVPQTEQCSL